MNDYIKVGKIVNTHGVRGCLKIMALTDELDRFDELEYVYTEKDKSKRKIRNVSYRKGMVFVELEGINDLTEAEKFKDSFIFIDESQLKELPDDTYYIFDLIGIKIYSEDEEYIGEIKDVFTTGANDVYEVVNESKEYYIPAIKDVVQSININEKRMIIKVIEGLLE